MSATLNPNAPQTAAAPAAEPGKPSRWRHRLQQLLAFAGLIIIFLAFTAVRPDVFPTFSNISTILYSAVVVGLLSLGATLVIVTAGIDLSCGTGMILSGVMAGTFITNLGLQVWLGVALAILFGGLMGAINGINVAIAGLPPFIATLAMMMVAGGLALVISNKAPIYFNGAPQYKAISTGSMIPGVQNAVLVLALAAVIAYIIFNKTLLGRYDVSIGSNLEATALSGINVKKWLIIIYSTAGLFTGLAGVMLSARLSSAQPTGGQGYELYAIAAVVIGGTSLSGGRGSIVGTVIGALIIAVIQNGLSISSVPQEWQNVILGLVILVTVFIDQLRTKRLTTT